MKPSTIFSILLFTSFFLPISASTAQWVTDPENPKRVSTTDTDQRKPQIFDDGNGGSFVFWRTYPPFENYFRVHAQHINASGSHLLGDTGKMVLYRTGKQISDYVLGRLPNGDFMLAWLEGNSGFRDSIMCQKLVTSNLIPAWIIPKKLAGKSAAFNILGYDAPQILVRDNQFFIGYQVVYFGGAGGTFLQKADFNGENILTQNSGNGQKIEGCSTCYGPFSIIESPMQGILLIQRDGNGTGAGLRSYRMNGNGSMVYTNKVLTDGTQGLNYAFHAVPDGTGGAAIAMVLSQNDLTLSRIDSLGNHLWTPSYVLLSSHPGLQNLPFVVKEGSDFYITYVDDQGAFDGNYTYIQKVNSQGELQYHNGGRKVFPMPGGFAPYPKLVSMNNGSVIATSGQVSTGFLGQRVLADSTLAWNPDGSLISTISHWPFYENYELLRGNLDNVLLAWQAQEGSTNKVYVSNLGVNGFLVDVEMQIISQETKAWPNPFADKIYVETPDNPEVLELFNGIGQKQIVQFDKKPVGYTVQPSALPTGTYFLRIKTAEGKGQTIRLLKM